MSDIQILSSEETFSVNFLWRRSKVARFQLSARRGLAVGFRIS